MMKKINNKIQNIYYMLTYSFNKDLIKFTTVTKVGVNAFENIYELLSIVLIIMLNSVIKRGVYKEYEDTIDEVVYVKGKINLSNTLKKNLLLKNRVFCEYDEFSTNNKINQVIKLTLTYLITSNKVCKNTRKNLNDVRNFFSEVYEIEKKIVNWNDFSYHKNNKVYKPIISLCELIIKGLITEDKEGNLHFLEFLDETAMHTIFENFVRAYFKSKGLEAKKRKFQLADEQTAYIGGIEEDIYIELNNNIFIIDTKFYSKILIEGRFEKSKIISMNNIYQINTYAEKAKFLNVNKNVEGMLLYAKTVEEPDLDIEFYIANKKIHVKTLDMNKDWDDITTSLNKIIDYFKKT